MVRVVNKSGLPEGIFRILRSAVERDPYTKGAARLSVTELIDSPRVRLLRREHDHDMEKDAASYLWALVGKALHSVLQDHASGHGISEQRLFAEVNGIAISGGIDLQEDEGDFTLTDWKLTSTFSLRSEKREWVEQLNSYAFLARQNGKPVGKLRVVAILRDWSQAQAERDPSYPQAPVVEVPVELWDEAEAESYVKRRVEAHLAAQRDHDFGSEVAECTEEERWMRESSFAVMKAGGKRAVKIFESKEDASFYAITKKGGYYVEERPASPVRCERNYCGVAMYCSQYQKGKASGE